MMGIKYKCDGENVENLRHYFSGMVSGQLPAPVIRQFTVTDFKPGHQYEFHSYDRAVELVYVLQGKSYLELDNRCVQISQQECLVIFPGTVHNYYLKRNESCRLLDLVFQPGDSVWGADNASSEDDFRFFHELLTGGRKFLRFLDERGMGSTLQNMFLNYRMNVQYRDELLRLGFCELFLKLSGIFGSPEADATPVNSKAVASAREFVQNFYTSDISLMDAAKAASLSTRQLSRLFVREMGMTVQEYIGFLRLKKAKELLAFSSMDITGIAFSLGFNSSDYFSTFFRKLEGLAPGAYRKLKQEYEEKPGKEDIS